MQILIGSESNTRINDMNLKRCPLFCESLRNENLGVCAAEGIEAERVGDFAD